MNADTHAKAKQQAHYCNFIEIHSISKLIKHELYYLVVDFRAEKYKLSQENAIRRLAHPFEREQAESFVFHKLSFYKHKEGEGKH